MPASAPTLTTLGPPRAATDHRSATSGRAPAAFAGGFEHCRHANAGASFQVAIRMGSSTNDLAHHAERSWRGRPRCPRSVASAPSCANRRRSTGGDRPPTDIGGQRFLDRLVPDSATPARSAFCRCVGNHVEDRRLVRPVRFLFTLRWRARRRSMKRCSAASERGTRRTAGLSPASGSEVAPMDRRDPLAPDEVFCTGL